MLVKFILERSIILIVSSTSIFKILKVRLISIEDVLGLFNKTSELVKSVFNFSESTLVLSDKSVGILNEVFEVGNGAGEVINSGSVSFIIGSTLVSQFL